VPGDQRINIRCDKDELSRLKQAAATKRMSLSMLVMTASMHAADKILGQDGELVETTVQPTSHPAKPISYGPDMPIGQMTTDQIRRYLAAELANEEQERERRLELAQYSDL
jgi:hypothetical protein